MTDFLGPTQLYQGCEISDLGLSSDLGLYFGLFSNFPSFSPRYQHPPLPPFSFFKALQIREQPKMRRDQPEDGKGREAHPSLHSHCSTPDKMFIELPPRRLMEMEVILDLFSLSLRRHFVQAYLEIYVLIIGVRQTIEHIITNLESFFTLWGTIQQNYFGMSFGLK